MLKKIAAFFKRLFCKQKQSNPYEEKQQQMEELADQMDEIVASLSSKSEEEQQQAKQDLEDLADKMDDVVDSMKEEKKEEFKILSDEDKNTILDILRPVIKGFNSDEFYVNLCKALAESKVLKTFSSVSEDGKELTIKLTQNEIFNDKISEYIDTHVIAAFRSSIDAEMFGKFEVNAADGAIVIRKVG